MVGSRRSSSSSSSSSSGEFYGPAVRHQFDQHLAHQAGLARSGNASHGRKYAQRKVDVEPMQVIACDAGQPQPAVRRARRCGREASCVRTDSSRVCDCSPAPALRADRCRASGRPVRRRPGRHRQSNRRGVSRQDRVRPRTANCRMPSTGRGPAGAPRCRRDAVRRKARRARTRRRTDSSAPGWPAAAAAARRARAWACCDPATDSRAPGRA